MSEALEERVRAALAITAVIGDTLGSALFVATLPDECWRR